MRYWKPKAISRHTKIGIAVASYLCGEDRFRRVAALQCLVQSFRAQTYENWTMRIVHDGPLPDIAHPIFNDSRVVFTTTPTRLAQFGHPHRQAALDELVNDRGAEWLGLTNDDNYYTPVYLEWLLAAATEKKALLAYCDAIHSHKLWKPLPGQLRRGHIDLGSFLLHYSLTEKVKFDKFTFAGDWDYINRLKQQTKKVAHVQANLFVHN